MKMRHFFHLKSVFSCFINTLAFVLFCWFVLLKNPHIYSLFIVFFGGRRRETVCLTEPQDFSFFYIDSHKRQHSWPATFCGQSCAGLTSPLDMLDNS